MNPFTLRVLGSSCSIPRPGRASSSYVVEFGGTALVADMGTGSFANLIAVRPADSMAAIVVSHLHADHVIDLIPLRYALKYGPRTHARRIELYLPPGGQAKLAAIAAAFASEGDGNDFLGDVFDVRTYDPSAVLRIGEIAVTFARTRHFIECYAMRFEAGSASVGYSADTAPCEAVVDLLRGVDVMVCEATLSVEEEAIAPRGHISAREAGRLAAAAGARRLVLSHYPASADPERMRALAAASYEQSVEVADDNCVYPVETAAALS